MKLRTPHQLYRNQFYGLLLVAALIFIAGIYRELRPEKTDADPKVEFLNTIPSVTPAVLLTEFDPNEIDAAQWQKLGFSERQAATILKYKSVVGGTFTSKEQLAKCYAISAEKFAELQPYILLPEKNSATANKFENNFRKKELNIPGRFNPNDLDAAAWQQMGFSEKQAAAIINYKNYLGGTFHSKEEIKACFIINEDNYSKMAPYLLLPEIAPGKITPTPPSQKPKIVLTAFDPNTLDASGWEKLGFTPRQAESILKYKNSYLKGSFRSLEDVERCYMIQARFQELKPYIRLNPENITMPTSTASFASENKAPAAPESKTDFSKTDLNQITFKQLREFGFTEKDAAILLSFRKKLGGFVNRSQVLETYEIDKELAGRLSAACTLNASNVAKYSLVDAPEEWLKNHPYFKYSADKIIYYRISNPDDKKIWKLLKAKPEYEAKMRLYLK